MSASIVWLASYPGSGNTWVRVFLSNLLAAQGAPADINELEVNAHAASRAWFDSYAGVETSDLTADEVLELRPAIYEAVAAEHSPPFFVKIHDAYTMTPSGEPLIPARATLGVIYIVRNPLDVAVSYAHHLDVKFDTAIRIMNDETYAIAADADRIVLQLKQPLGSWSTHVESWLDAPGLRIHTVRYEDLVDDAAAQFAAIAEFAGLSATPASIDQAIRFSAFDELQQQENKAGFVARSRRARRFFRRGEVGAWRDELTASQVETIMQNHGAVMRRLGYLKP